jgi:DNA-binding transcriptional LysR family regulator
MIDWDDVRYFLAVARGGSVRAAAEAPRGESLDRAATHRSARERLGAQMFEKLPSGYRLTAAGEEVLELANQMEASSHQLETRVFGRDQSVRGLLRVTLAPPLATHLLMPDFADFARLHPDIEMEILSSGELANLTNREADVAIRVVYDRKTLPLNLHGLKGPELFGGVYMSRDRLAAWRAGAPDPIRWIVISIHGIPDWASEGEVRTTGVPFRTTDGRGADRCCTARARDDDTAVLRRRCRPPAGEGAGHRPAHVRNALASHTGETRKTKRVRLFTEFVSRRWRVRALSRGCRYRRHELAPSPSRRVPAAPAE